MRNDPGPLEEMRLWLQEPHSAEGSLIDGGQQGGGAGIGVLHQAGACLAWPAWLPRAGDMGDVRFSGKEPHQYSGRLLHK